MLEAKYLTVNLDEPIVLGQNFGWHTMGSNPFEVTFKPIENAKRFPAFLSKEHEKS